MRADNTKPAPSSDSPCRNGLSTAHSAKAGIQYFFSSESPLSRGEPGGFAHFRHVIGLSMRFPNALNAAARYRDSLTDPVRADRACSRRSSPTASVAIYATIAKSSAGPALRHGRGDRLVARSRLRLSQASAARRGIVGCGSASFRSPSGPITCGDGDAGSSRVVRLRLSRTISISRARVGLALTLIPFFNFHALSQPSHVLIPLWP